MLSYIPTENFKEQEEYAEQLALAQGIYQEVSRLEEAIEDGKQYKRPSLIKYSVLYTLAITTDAVDLLEFTGVGYFIAKAYKLACNGAIIFILWLTNTKQKNAHQYTESLENIVSEAQANLAHYTRLTLRAAKIGKTAGKYIPVVGQRITKISSKVPRILVKIRRKAMKNPVTKFFWASAADFVPFLDLVPWTTLGVWLSYRDEKSSYQQAQEAALDIEGQLIRETV